MKTNARTELKHAKAEIEHLRTFIKEILADRDETYRTLIAALLECQQRLGIHN